MKEDFGLCLVMLLIIGLIAYNSGILNNSFCENMTGPTIFQEEGYGESGTYVGNNNIEPMYRLR
jgi:hypothetical protein